MHYVLGDVGHRVFGSSTATSTTGNSGKLSAGAWRAP
jgi:hypothetical protein